MVATVGNACVDMCGKTRWSATKTITQYYSTQYFL